MNKTNLMMLLAGSTCAVFAQNDTTNRNTGTNGTTGTNTNMGNNTYNNNNGSMNGTWGTNSSMSSNNSYNAYGTFNATAPDYLQGYVLRDYPTATDIRWQQSTDWWHGYYMNNGQPVNMYYNTAGQTFNVALPVKQSLVPDAVVSKAISMYGPMLYDITAVRGTNGQDIYMVRTLENGQVASQWMGEDGTKVIDVYRVESNDAMNHSMNNTGSYNSNNGTMNNGSQMTNGQSSDQSAMYGSSDMNSSTSGTNTSTGKDKLKIKTKSADGKVHKTKLVNGKMTTKGDQNQ